MEFKCKKCGHQLVSETSQCPVCQGDTERLDAEEEVTPSNGGDEYTEFWFCDTCGHSIHPNKTVCPQCGYSPEDVAVQVVSEPAPHMKTHYNQAVFILRDCSVSMRGQKARNASRVADDIISELADPINRDGFWVMIIDFQDDASVVQPLTKATDVRRDIPRIRSGGSKTNITKALEIVLATLTDHSVFAREGIKWHNPVVLLFTDGINTPSGEADPVVFARDLKQKKSVIAVATFEGWDRYHDHGTLVKIATSPKHIVAGARFGEDLLKFVAKVGVTTTTTIEKAGVKEEKQAETEGA